MYMFYKFRVLLPEKVSISVTSNSIKIGHHFSSGVLHDYLGDMSVAPFSRGHLHLEELDGTTHDTGRS